MHYQMDLADSCRICIFKKGLVLHAVLKCHVFVFTLVTQFYRTDTTRISLQCNWCSQSLST